MTPPRGWAPAGVFSPTPASLGRSLYAEHELCVHMAALGLCWPLFPPAFLRSRRHPSGCFSSEMFPPQWLDSRASWSQEGKLGHKKENHLLMVEHLGSVSCLAFLLHVPWRELFRGPASWHQALWAACPSQVRSSRHFCSFSFCLQVSGHLAQLPLLPSVLLPQAAAGSPLLPP